MRLEPVTLHGGRVTLEPLRLAHAGELWPAADDRDLWRYMGMDVRTAEDLAAWIDARVLVAKAGRAQAFLQRAGGKAVGCTSLFDLDATHRHAEVGHTWLVSSARRDGTNAEAKRLLLRHAFGTLGLERVQFRCDIRNVASQGALAKLGAQREGVLRRHRQRPDGSWRDTVVYSIIRPEWPAVEAALVARVAAQSGA